MKKNADKSAFKTIRVSGLRICYTMKSLEEQEERKAMAAKAAAAAAEAGAKAAMRAELTD